MARKGGAYPAPAGRTGAFRRAPLSAAGFTLLEVMVAVAILGAGLGAVTAGIAMAVRTTALAEGYEQARLIAEERLTLFLADWQGGEEERNGIDGGRSWRITARAHRPVAGLYEIAVEVGFHGTGGERSYRLETREVERGLARGR